MATTTTTVESAVANLRAAHLVRQGLTREYFAAEDELIAAVRAEGVQNSQRSSDKPLLRAAFIAGAKSCHQIGGLYRVGGFQYRDVEDAADAYIESLA